MMGFAQTVFRLVGTLLDSLSLWQMVRCAAADPVSGCAQCDRVS